MTTKSEPALNGKLEDSGRPHCCCNLPKLSTAEVGMGRAEVRVVQNVERFDSDLSPNRFGDSGLFENRQIDIRESRSGNDVSSGISGRCLAELRGRKSAGIEVMRERTLVIWKVRVV